MSLSRAIQLAEKVIIDGIEYSYYKNTVRSSEGFTLSLKDFLNKNRNARLFKVIHKNSSIEEIDLESPEYWQQVNLEISKQLALDAIHNKEELICQFKKYLEDTDYKVLPDYDKIDGIDEIKIKRQHARDSIRALEQEILEGISSYV